MCCLSDVIAKLPVGGDVTEWLYLLDQTRPDRNRQVRSGCSLRSPTRITTTSVISKVAWINITWLSITSSHLNVLLMVKPLDASSLRHWPWRHSEEQHARVKPLDTLKICCYCSLAAKTHRYLLPVQLSPNSKDVDGAVKKTCFPLRLGGVRLRSEDPGGASSLFTGCLQGIDFIKQPLICSHLLWNHHWCETGDVFRYKQELFTSVYL